MKIGVKKFILVIIDALSALAFSMAFIALCDLYLNPSKNKPSTYSAIEIKDENTAEEAIKKLFAGEGTESSPFLIQSKEDLSTFSALIYEGVAFPGKYFKLMEDLDYTDEAFVPIGAKIEDGVFKGYGSFCGVFDGNNHTISNLNVTVSSCKIEEEEFGAELFGYKSTRLLTDGLHVPNIGLFAVLGSANATQYQYYNPGFLWYDEAKYSSTISGDYTAEIKNIRVQNFAVSNLVGGAYIGGIVGRVATRAYDYLEDGIVDTESYDLILDAKITNCVVESFNLIESITDVYVGGIVSAHELFKPSQYVELPKLYIENCIVANFHANYQTDGKTLPGHISMLSPVYSSLVYNTSYRYNFSKEAFCMFKYNYDLISSYTDADDYFYTYCGDYITTSWGNANEEPHESYTPGGNNCQNVGYLLWIMSAYEEYESVINNSKTWFYEESYGLGYLMAYMGEFSFASNNDSYGKVVMGDGIDLTYDEVLSDWGVDALYAPKKFYKILESDETVLFIQPCVGGDGYYEGNGNIGDGVINDAVYTLRAEPKEGYVFDSWQVTVSGDKTIYSAIFKKDYITITFKDVDGTSAADNVTFDVKKGGSIEICFTTNLSKYRAWTECTFKFKQVGETEYTTVVYTLTNDSKYIKNAKVGSKTYSTNDTASVSSNQTFEVTLADRNYNSVFG